MTGEKAWLDRLVCDIVEGKQEANDGKPVSVEDILEEAKRNCDVEDEEILRWIAICERKQLIRKIRPSGYGITDLDEIAKNLGIAELFKN